MSRTSPSNRTPKKRKQQAGRRPGAASPSPAQSKRPSGSAGNSDRPGADGSTTGQNPRATPSQSRRLPRRSANGKGSGQAGKVTEPDSQRAEARTFEQIARAIDDWFAMIELPVRSNLVFAVKIGQLLLEAKAQVPHGQFILWRTEHWPDLSKSTANEYLQFAAADFESVGTAIAKARSGGLLTLKRVLKHLRDPKHKNAKASKECRSAARRVAASASGKSAPGEEAIVLPSNCTFREFIDAMRPG